MPTKRPPGSDARWIAPLASGKAKLDEVPEGERTAAVCLAAVEQNGRALAYVPEDLKTLELCRAAVNNPKGGSDARKYVPENLRLKL